MFDIKRERGLYKAPKKEILKNRKAFYELKRRKSETTDKWLQRIKKCIDCCDFPMFIEFLVIDRFVCGLNKTEMEIILNTEAWSLKQLLENFLNRNGDKVKNGRSKRNVSTPPVDSESVSTLKKLTTLRKCLHSFYCMAFRMIILPTTIILSQIEVMTVAMKEMLLWKSNR